MRKGTLAHTGECWTKESCAEKGLSAHGMFLTGRKKALKTEGFINHQLLPDEVFNILEVDLLSLIRLHELHGHIFKCDIAGVLHRQAPCRLDTVS